MARWHRYADCMKLLKPLLTLTGFRRAFDNGGHFWSIWSGAGDGVITTAEMSKGAASLAAGRTAVLHFELLRGHLPAQEAKHALALLDKKALARWKKHEPQRCSAAEALSKPAGTAVIVESEPVPADDPEGEGIAYTHIIMVGKVMVPVVAPIVSRYRLWRLDGRRRPGRSTLLATEPKRLDLSGRRLAIGAVVHESTAKPPAGQSKRRCLIGVAACPI